MFCNPDPLQKRHGVTVTGVKSISKGRLNKNEGPSLTAFVARSNRRSTSTLAPSPAHCSHSLRWPWRLGRLLGSVIFEVWLKILVIDLKGLTQNNDKTKKETTDNIKRKQTQTLVYNVYHLAWPAFSWPSFGGVFGFPGELASRGAPAHGACHGAVGFGWSGVLWSVQLVFRGSWGRKFMICYYFKACGQVPPTRQIVWPGYLLVRVRWCIFEVDQGKRKREGKEEERWEGERKRKDSMNKEEKNPTPTAWARC